MDVVAEIKARLNIVDFLSGYVEVKKAGRYYKACCPFHHEKTPSFMISPERGYAHCFGCQNGGDIIKLCELLEGVDFREAVKLLAEKAGVQIPDNFGGGAKKEKKDRLIEINEAAADWFVAELGKTSAAREYLASRGLSMETIQNWRIGYAPDRREGLAANLRSKYSPPELAEAGVAGVRELGGSEMYDRFRARVMFPICDHTGHVVAFTGRILGAGEPKYLNSPESPVFQKGAVLFALDQAKEAIRSSGRAIIVEGQMDVISCHQAGFTNVVASSGTALTEMHLAAVKRLVDTVVFCFDADIAGVASTKRAIPLALAADLNVAIVRLPADCKDPDDVLRQDVALLRVAFERPASVLEWYFDVAFAGYDWHDAVYKKTAARELAAIAKAFVSAVEREEFLKKAARRLGVSEAALADECARLPSFAARTDSVEQSTPAPRTAEMFEGEDLLLALVLAHPDLVGELTVESFTRAENRTTFATLADPTIANERAETLRLLAATRYGEFTDAALAREVETLKAALIKRSHTDRLRELKIKIDAAEAAGRDDEAAALFAEYQTLRKSVDE